MATRAVKVDPKRAVTEERDLRPATVDEAAIAARAFELWEQRGRPIGSDLDDWFRAEQELKGISQSTSA